MKNNFFWVGSNLQPITLFANSPDELVNRLKKLIESDESVAYPIDQLRKILKFWYNVPWRIRNLTKKWCTIPSSDEGEMTKTS